jgi:hypothetical protein
MLKPWDAPDLAAFEMWGISMITTDSTDSKVFAPVRRTQLTNKERDLE